MSTVSDDCASNESILKRRLTKMSKTNGPLSRLSQWAKDWVAQDVPEDIALCAFDCSKGQCTLEEWESCERRLNNAAGELMPAKEGHPKEAAGNDVPAT
jgi:hypothetical protein